MKTIFVDSNVFLRFLTQDSEAEQARAARLFQQAGEGKVALVTSPPVLFDLAWRLRKLHGLPREDVLDCLAATCAVPGLRIVDSELVEQAIGLSRRTNLDFADAYIQVSAVKAGADEVATFNRKHFERLGAKLADL